MAYRHVSAMLKETIECLACRPGGIYVDCTLGGAGHAKAVCELISPTGRFIGIDQDGDAIANGRERLAPYADIIHLFHGNYIHLPDYLNQLHIEAVDGILLDLGLSQHQLDTSGRGFSFQKDEPLDMRMDIRTETTAADLVNQLPAAELVRIFRKFGEERWSKRIAQAIAGSRQASPIRTTGQLVRLVKAAIPARSAAQQKIHPATRIFMALRIAVNRELERLDQFLTEAIGLLNPGGRLCILSFHSLEDRMVKQRFKQWTVQCTCPPALPQCICGTRPLVKLINKKVLRPAQQEVERNPMARSTRLRCVEKLAT